MYLRQTDIERIVRALRFWQGAHAHEMSSEDLEALCGKLAAPPIGYVVPNLSGAMPTLEEARYDFPVTGEDPCSYGCLQDAAEQVANLMEEYGHTWETTGVYGLYRVPTGELDRLIIEAPWQSEHMGS